MPIDEIKYNNLFFEKFKVPRADLDQGFEKFVVARGKTEKAKLAFYEVLFKMSITRFKDELPKDDNYDYIISALYDIFINALKADGIDVTKHEAGLMTFKYEEYNRKEKLRMAKSDFQPVSKQYNLNTKYGRRKARDHALYTYENGSPEYRKEIDRIGVVVWLIIIAIALIIFFVKIGLAS